MQEEIIEAFNETYRDNYENFEEIKKDIRRQKYCKHGLSTRESLGIRETSLTCSENVEFSLKNKIKGF